MAEIMQWPGIMTVLVVCSSHALHRINGPAQRQQQLHLPWTSGDSRRSYSGSLITRAPAPLKRQYASASARLQSETIGVSVFQPRFRVHGL
jgi:hypothetical protein